MYDVNVRDLSLPDGKLGGLPYYSGFNSFVGNTKHLETAKLQAPATWDEFLDQCRKLKKDGIAEFPYVSAWQRQWASLSWSLFSIWYSEGAKVFDEKFNPVFDDKFKKVLELHRTLYSEGLVQPDIFTLDTEGVPTFATGQHTYMVLHEYDQKVLNDPKMSQIAGAAKNFLMPGATRSTFIWTALYLMGANPIDVTRVFNLMQFFGGKSKDGQYHVDPPLGARVRPRHPLQGGHPGPRGPGRVHEMEGHRGLQQAAGDRDPARRLEDHVVPRMGLVHDGRGAGLYSRPTADRPAGRQAPEEGGRGQGAVPGLKSEAGAKPPASRPKDRFRASTWLGVSEGSDGIYRRETTPSRACRRMMLPRRRPTRRTTVARQDPAPDSPAMPSTARRRTDRWR